MNPVTTNFYVDLPHVYENIRIKLFDTSGQKLIDQFYHHGYTLSVPCDQLQAGIYLLQINYDSKIFTKKIVKL